MGWDDDDDDSNPHGYTLDPDADDHDDADDTAATAPIAAPPAPAAPAAPPPNVVQLADARQVKRLPPLPRTTGVGTFRADHPVHEVDPLLTNLRESELTDDTINAAQLACIHHTQWRAFGFYSKPRADLDPTTRANMAGVLLPFFAPGSTEPCGYRLRPEVPLRVPPKRPGGKPRFKKYDQPRGTDVLVYTPPLPACVDQLRSDAPLYWTEGEKKALLLAQLGLCVVGLTGVENWSAPGSKSSELHPYIAQHYGITGREHVIVFDADAATNPHVLLAMRKLAGLLLSLGAVSVTSALPPLAYDGTKQLTCKGIDDFAHMHGCAAALDHLHQTRDEIAAVSPRLHDQPLFDALGGGDDTTVTAPESRMVVPSPYAVDDDGVWLQGAPDESKRLVLPRPVYVSRHYVDVHRDSEYRVEMRFQTSHGQWRTITVPRGLGTRALVAELRRYGAMTDETSGADLMRWLAAWEARNGAQLQPVRCVTRTGWCDGQFALGTDRIITTGDAAPLYLDGAQSPRMFGALGYRGGDTAPVATHAAALHRAVTVADECAIAVFAALSAPLLRPFALPNFAVHLCGASSRGKTSMMRCAASIYGDPSSSDFVPSWNITATALELRAAQLCDLPLCFDEAGVGDPAQIQAAIYMLVNGTGRARAGKDIALRATEHWRTVVVSTGEHELVPEEAATGAQARLIAVPVLGFGSLDGPGVDALVSECTAGAGAFGELWLRYVVDLVASPSRMMAMRERFAGYKAQLRVIAERNGNPMAARHVGYFASLMLAEAMASELGVGWPDGATMLRAFDERLTGADGDHGDALPMPPHERVSAALVEWVAAQPSAFPLITVTDGRHEAPTSGRPVIHGYVREDNSAVHVLPAALRRYLADAGVSWTRALRRELMLRGVMVSNDGVSHQSLIQVNGRRARCYTLLFG